MSHSRAPGVFFLVGARRQTSGESPVIAVGSPTRCGNNVVVAGEIFNFFFFFAFYVTAGGEGGRRRKGRGGRGDGESCLIN